MTDGDFEAECDTPTKAVSVAKRPRFQALNDDMMWIAEEDIRRTKQTMKARQGPLNDKEHARFIKTAEALRKLRLTDAELNKMNAPSDMDVGELDAEFEERCRERGLDPVKVAEVFGV